jgi:hypothetical protein
MVALDIVVSFIPCEIRHLFIPLRSREFYPVCLHLTNLRKGHWFSNIVALKNVTL